MSFQNKDSTFILSTNTLINDHSNDQFPNSSNNHQLDEHQNPWLILHC